MKQLILIAACLFSIHCFAGVEDTPNQKPDDINESHDSALAQPTKEQLKSIPPTAKAKKALPKKKSKSASTDSSSSTEEKK